MSDRFVLAADRRIGLVSDMFSSDPEEFRVNASERLVQLAREPGNNILPESPFIAGLAAAARFQPEIDSEDLAEAYARLSMSANDRDTETMTGRDVARLLVSFSRATNGLTDMGKFVESEDALRLSQAMSALPVEKQSDNLVSASEIVSSNMLLSDAEAMDLDASVRIRDVSEDIYVRPHSSDITQAHVLFMVMTGEADKLGQIEPDFIDRNAVVLAGAAAIWDNKDTFNHPVTEDMMIGVMSNAIASREAGQKMGSEEFEASVVMNNMALEIVMRQEAEELIAAYKDPSLVSDMRILESVVTLDEDTSRFFRAVQLGRFDRLEFDDMVALRHEVSSSDYIPAEVISRHEDIETKVDQIRFAVMHDGNVNAIFGQPEFVELKSDAPASEEKPELSERKAAEQDAGSESALRDPVQKDAGIPADPAISVDQQKPTTAFNPSGIAPQDDRGM